jgi:hypothetical protein
MRNPFGIILIVLLALAVLPTWPYSRGWGVGYYPVGGIVVLLIVLLLLGVI